MDRYRKKPVIVEAYQWFPPKEDSDELPAPGVFCSGRVSRYTGSFEYYVLTIHNQRVILAPGDWVIREPDGVHFYPCKPEIFEATYEKVEEGESNEF